MLSISLGGIIDTNTVLDDTSQEYQLTSDLTIESGAILDIRSGVVVRSANPDYEIQIFGSVFSSNATLTGHQTEIFVEAGGRLNLLDSNVPAGQYIWYKPGSSGVMADSQFGSLGLRLYSDTVSVNRNTFTTEPVPIESTPSLLGQLTSNSFGVTTDVTPVNSGVAAADNATGLGYIMYSAQSVHDRFAQVNASNADHLIAVRLNGNQWQYTNIDGDGWIDFSPVYTDHLLADVDFSADTVTSLLGTSSTVRGIKAGYDRGDLVFTPNMWNGNTNNGEFGVTGSFFGVDSIIQVSGAADVNSNWFSIPNVVYQLTSDIAIPSGISLYITPNVEVDSQNGFIIDGTLYAYGVDFTGDQTNFQVNNGGKLALRDSSIPAGNQIDLRPGSMGSLAANSFGDILLRADTETVSVNNNSFSSTFPVAIRPSNLPKLYNNTFSTPDSMIRVNGVATSNASWVTIPNVSQYVLIDVTIPSGVSIAVYQGVEMLSQSTMSKITVQGTLYAFGAEFVGINSKVHVMNGGRFTAGNGTRFWAGVGDSTILGGNSVVFNPGSFGNVIGNTFDVSQLRLYSDGVFLRNNSFKSLKVPIQVSANLVPKILTSQFLTPGAIVEVTGEVTSGVEWRPRNNLQEYRLSSDVTVQPGANLVFTNVQVRADSDMDFFVNGTLTAQGSTIVGGSILEVRSGGRLNILSNTSVAAERIAYQDGSEGTISYSNLFVNNINLHDDSNALIQFNTFPSGIVTTFGAPARTINFKNMYWGTTNLNVIRGRIFDRNDNPNRPLLIFEPILTSPPNGPGGGGSSSSTGDDSMMSESKIKPMKNQIQANAGSQQLPGAKSEIRDHTFATFDMTDDGVGWEIGFSDAAEIVVLVDL